GTSSVLPAGPSRFALARYLPNGLPDPSFGVGGQVTTTDVGQGTDAGGFAVAIQKDGRIVVAGSATVPSGNEFGLARYLPDGSLDPTFGSGGTLSAGLPGADDGANAVVILKGGKILCAGWTRLVKQDFALARFNKDGTPDSSFGVGGFIATDFDGGDDT